MKERGRPRIGVALGAGGPKGFAHVGVLRALEAHGIPIDYMAGTSIGAVVAALWAQQTPTGRMAEIARQVRSRDLFDRYSRMTMLAGLTRYIVGRRKDRRLLPTGLVRGQKLENTLHLWTQGARMEDLPRHVAIVASDIHHGCPFIFTTKAMAPLLEDALPRARINSDAPISLAVRASSSVPGFFSPVEFDGCVLMDGFLVDRVPVQVVRAMGADIVIGVDISTWKAYRGGIHDIIAQALNLVSGELTRLKLAEHADLVLRPRVHPLPIDAVEEARGFILSGVEAVEANLPALKRAIEEFRPQPEGATPLVAFRTEG